MICFKCKNEIPDESVFCPKCGNRLTELAVDGKADDSGAKRKGLRWLIIALAALACAALLAVAGIMISKKVKLAKEVEQFQSFMEAQEYTEAQKYYTAHESEQNFVEKADQDVRERYEKAVQEKDDKAEVALFNCGLLTEEYVGEIEETVRTKIEEIKERYLEEGGTVKEFRGEMRKYQDYDNETIAGLADDANDEMKIMIQSRDAYRRAEKAAEEKKYAKALEDYTKVIEEDAKYSDAQAKIKEIVPLYKKQVLKQVEKNVKENDFDPAVGELKTLKKYCTDSDVASKLSEVQQQKTAYDTEQRRIQAQQYKDSQEVEAISAETVNQGYYIQLLKGQVVVRNNSDKVVKDVKVGLLFFDANGYPVDSTYSFLFDNDKNLGYSTYDACNIQPGETYGSQWVFNIPERCSKIKACVKSVTYMNGLPWDNPYFDYWLEDNKAAY